MTATGVVKILDFGLAKHAESEPALTGMSRLPTTPPMTDAGTVLGTPGYMAPEQIRGLPSDYRSDIFVLGAILYEMLAGRGPFTAETGAEMMTAILKEDPPDLPREARRIPPNLGRVVARCLEKNPSERFQTARDLAFALESAMLDFSLSVSTARSRADDVAPARARAAWMVATISLMAVGMMAIRRGWVSSATLRRIRSSLDWTC